MTTSKLTVDQVLALRHLVYMRSTARRLIRAKQANMESIRLLKVAHATSSGDLKSVALHKIDLTEAKDTEIELRFQIIEVGLEFMGSCSKYDKLPREVWLRALSVNESEWSSPMMLEYGDCVRNVVAVLRMENSATGTEEDWDIVHKPLNWCVTMAMMNASQTSPAFGKKMHDLSNEVMDGAFGEWKEPTVLEQIGVRH
jgi:hypothetical protein